MNPDARDLTAALNGGADGQAAFARVYDRHAPVVRALCRQHVGRRSEAEVDDALQETFIRAFTMLAKVEDPEKLRPWLYAIARRVCAERRRAGTRRSHHEATGVRVVMNGFLEQTARDGSPGPQAAGPCTSAEHAEQLARLDQALDELPDKERLAIHFYYLDNDPVAAAHSCLGLSRSGFYKLLAKATERLAILMSEARTA